MTAYQRTILFEAERARDEYLTNLWSRMFASLAGAFSTPLKHRSAA